MRAFLGPLLVYTIIKVFLLAIGIGVGFLLHWLIPAIETGTSVLIGVVATGLSMHFFGRVTSFIDNYDSGADPEIEPKVVIISDPIAPLRSGRGRKRKPS